MKDITVIKIKWKTTESRPVYHTCNSFLYWLMLMRERKKVNVNFNWLICFLAYDLYIYIYIYIFIFIFIHTLFHTDKSTHTHSLSLFSSFSIFFRHIACNFHLHTSLGYNDLKSFFSRSSCESNFNQDMLNIFTNINNNNNNNHFNNIFNNIDNIVSCKINNNYLYMGLITAYNFKNRKMFSIKPLSRWM